MAKRITTFLAAPACVALIAVAFLNVPTPTARERGEAFVPRPDVARASSLGFEALLADWYWLLAVQVVGRAATPVAEAPLLARLIDVVTSVDPWVDHPYRFAAVWLTDTPDRVRKANEILRRGVDHHPDEWRNHFYLGFNHFFYLAEDDRAAEVLEQAVELPGAPVYLKRLVARLKAGSAGLEVGAAFLRELAQNAEDPYARAEYEKALEEVETERVARLLDQARAEYRRRSGRDIERVDDLTQGPHAVLRALPPQPHDDAGWKLDDEGRIVSAWYGHRYEPQFQGQDRVRAQLSGPSQEEEGG